MIDVKQAVAKAFEFVGTLYEGEGFQVPQLEEVELSPDDSKWLITVSFLRPKFLGGVAKQVRDAGLMPPQYEREYKLITLSADDGTVQSMKIRQLAF
ncbi:MAG: hypothetical protein JW888_06120 [Pirellulales bacterium]|nr:hypothetical protein [Pirellulales bacterium]